MDARKAKSEQLNIGLEVANVLRGSWYSINFQAGPSEELVNRLAPIVFHSGVAALAWWRVRESALAETRIGRELHEAYRRYRLSARIHEQEICNIFARLRDAGIEPVLVKGWSIARKYPDPALRPYGDIDICVRPDQYEDAKQALKYFESVDGHYFDLHQGIDSVGRGNLECAGSTALFNGRKQSGVKPPHSKRWDDVFARTQLVPLGDAPSSLGEGNGVRVARAMVRVLSEEDHLRVLCHHFLLSGAWRPLWLVDVAVALETASPDFDWDICLGPNRKFAQWTRVTVDLAQTILGAEVRGQRSEVSPDSRLLTPVSPRWLTAALLRQWGRCQNPSTIKGTLPTLMELRSQPRELLREIYARWDNPIRSTARLQGAYNAWPRAPYQILEIVQRMRAEVPKQLLSTLRRTRVDPRSMEQRNQGYEGLSV